MSGALEIPQELVEESEEGQDPLICDSAEEDQYLPEEVDEEVLKILLSKHFRCASHSLALLATTDFEKIVESNKILKKKHKRALRRCGGLWNLKFQARQEILKEKLGFELKRPIVCRWNSLYDSVKQIVSSKDKFDAKLFEELGIKNGLTRHDFAYLEDYVRIMKLLAETLDLLQGEKECFYGCLSPNLVSLKNKWTMLAGTIRASQQSLVTKLRECLDNRFADFFDITGNGRDAAIAAMVHPKFKKKWAKGLSEDSRQQIRAALTQAGVELYNEMNEISTSQSQGASSDYMFSLPTHDSPEDMFPTSTNTVESILTTYLQMPCGENFSAVKEFPLIHKLFMRYNTILPSSAAVERLFSYATMTDIPKLSRLSDKNFECRVVARAYMEKMENS